MSQITILATRATPGLVPLALLLMLQTGKKTFRTVAHVELTPRHIAEINLAHVTKASVNLTAKHRAVIEKTAITRATIHTGHKSEGLG